LAIKPRDNETFYREVDEELRRDQLAGMWSRYGWTIALGIMLLLAAIGGAIYWQHRRDVRASEQGERFIALLRDAGAGKAKEVAPKLDGIAAESGPGYRAAALLTKADLAIQAGDDATAAAAYKTVAEDGDMAQAYRDLATIRQTAVEFDKLPPATVIARLQPLAVAGKPWFGSASEMVALAQLKAKRPDLAGPIFAALSKDETLPESLRSRAMQMAGALGFDAVPADAAEGPAATKEETR
jgi:hypothetical protein